jgi:hypothetical protein
MPAKTRVETPPTTTYCTILSGNYLAKALTLAGSLERHHPGTELVVLVIDALTDDQLPEAPGVRAVSLSFLGLPEREVLQMATIYGLVEFATAVKPRLLTRLLEETEQASYLDPDTYVTSPMVELPRDLRASEHGILLTPHFLEPVTAGAQLTEGHLLNVGFYNLGFCAIDRRAQDFLDWWWGHLKTECLWDPLSGLFVDQKWVDIGAPLFRGTTWRHPGYNVSVANLHERPIIRDDTGRYSIATNGEPLRLFHFHAFDTQHPEELSTRFDKSTAHLRMDSKAVDALCREYADELIAHEQALAPAAGYPFATDTRGRRVSQQLRRVYRLQSEGRATPLPSPYLPAEAAAYDAWRRSAWKSVGRELAGDAAKSVRLALPEEYASLKKKFPRLAEKVRGKTVRSSGIWSG